MRAIPLHHIRAARPDLPEALIVNAAPGSTGCGVDHQSSSPTRELRWTQTDTPIADQHAKARADLDKATTAVKLANAKRARLAAEVRVLEAEAEIEAMRIQARADRERAEEAEKRAAAAEDASSKSGACT